MNTINYYKLIITISFSLLVCSSGFSQSSVGSEIKDDLIKTEIKAVEKVQSTRNDNKINDQTNRKVTKKLFSVSSEDKQVDEVKVIKSSEDSGTSEEVSLGEQPTKENNIEVNIDAGQRMTQTLVIENSSDSPLIWNISHEGSEKLLYRLYDKDRGLLKQKDKSGQISDAVLTSEVHNAKETLMKVTDSENYNINSNTFLTDVNLFEQKHQINQDNLINELSDSHLSEFLDNDKTPGLLKTSIANKSKEITSLNDNNIDVRSTRITDKTKLLFNTETSQKNVDGTKPENRLEIFKQWFRFSDYGRPVFDPQREVWEVSCDNGVHWMQILNINGEEYVTNAIYFDPAFYLEYHVIKKRNSPYSKLTLLSEFVKQVERGPTVIPTSGIIPPQSEAEIEFEIDASSTQSGTYIPRVVLTSPTSFDKITEIPIQCNVVKQSEEIISNRLTKQTTGEQLPDKYEMSQNYPNPFNPSTTIKYSIMADGLVTLKVYDVLGSEVTTLINENKQAGFYEAVFNASSLANGVYFYRLQSGDFVATKKMVLLK